MNLSDQQIQDFIEAWRKDFGEILSFDAAEMEAKRLLDFFTFMDQMLRSQRGGETAVPSSPLDERAGVKEAWRKTMGRGRQAFE